MNNIQQEQIPISTNSSLRQELNVKNYRLISFINQHQNIFLKVIYIANIIVTFVVGTICLFFTNKAGIFVFRYTYQSNDVMKIIGSFWISIGIVSFMGLFNPLKFSAILIIQIIYKGLYLIVQIIPRLSRQQIIPAGVSIFFLVWVILLPFIVPWRYIFSK